MQILRASWRFGLAAAALAIGAIVIVLAALVPVRRAGVPAPLHVARMLSKLFLRIFGVRVVCDAPEKLRQHTGIIFCNHLSYLDILVLLSVAPVRFLSARGVQRLPFIGWIATAIETVFVNRGDQESRAQARQMLAAQLRTRAYPPLVIFPEGKIGPGDSVRPFRKGAFEIAAAENIACLLCTLHYAPLSIATYYASDDTLPKAVWRLAAHHGPVVASLYPLDALGPLAKEDAVAAANQAHRLLQRAYDAERIDQRS